MHGNDTTILLSWQLLLIPPLIASCCVVQPGTSHPLVFRHRSTGLPECQKDQIPTEPPLLMGGSGHPTTPPSLPPERRSPSSMGGRVSDGRNATIHSPSGRGSPLG